MAGYSFGDEYWRSKLGTPTADPTATSQAQEWLKNRAQARATGLGAAPAPAASPVAPTPGAAPAAVPASAQNILTKPISGWGALKGVGKGLWGALTSRPVGMAGAAVAGAGALTAGMAGGNVVEGALRPDLLLRAVGEGYGRFAPTWMGGLSPSEIAAGDSQGASDIEGRFDVPMPARPASASLPVTPTGPSEGAGLYADQIATPKPLSAGFGVALPPVAAMTAGDIRGNRVPASGTGAFVNNSTGAVTNLDTREVAGPGAGPMVDAATYDRMRGFASRGASVDRYNPTTAAGSFFQAGADMKTRANTEAAQLTNAKLLYDVAKTQGTNRVTMRGQDLTADAARAKLGAEAGLRTAQTFEQAAKAENVATRTAAAREYLKGNPGDYAGAAGIASGRPLPTDKFGVMPSMSGNDVITYDKSGRVAPKIQTPMRPVTAANIDAAMTGSMKGKTRAQVIQAYKDKGYDVSGIK